MDSQYLGDTKKMQNMLDISMIYDHKNSFKVFSVLEINVMRYFGLTAGDDTV